VRNPFHVNFFFVPYKNLDAIALIFYATNLENELFHVPLQKINTYEKIS